jgi:hypothetical protein
MPDDGHDRVDFGALRVPLVRGVRFRIATAGPIPAVVATDGASALELSVLAAPRHDSLWPTVREDIIRSAPADGPCTCVEGPYGPELRLPMDTSVGRIPGRIVGFDGPRWFLCAVFTGPGAADATGVPRLDDLLRGTIVVRGEGAMPVRDPLPLMLAPAATATVPEPRPEPETVFLDGLGGRQRLTPGSAP